MFENGGRVYKALVKSSNSTTGEIKVSIPQVFGASNEVGISFIGRSAVNGVWRVPTPGSVIVVATDDDQLSNVFWMEQNNATPSDISSVSSSISNLGVYTDFTPNWSNLTVGNGTTVARYSQIGKMVHYYVQFTMGSTSVMGTSPYLTVPVTNKASVIQPSHVGFARNTPGGPNYNLQCIVFEDGKMYLTVLGGNNFTATSPFTWATDDFFIISGVYEAA